MTLTDERNAIDRTFDRSAGRWCNSCQQYGSHHSDKHQEFLDAALDSKNQPVVD